MNEEQSDDYYLLHENRYGSIVNGNGYMVVEYNCKVGFGWARVGNQYILADKNGNIHNCRSL